MGLTGAVSFNEILYLKSPTNYCITNTLATLQQGSDTTTSAIAGICFLLAAHQRVQQKARQEVYEVISEYHFTQEITKDHLKQMIYLESVIKESLRIVTPGRAFGRRIGADIRLS